MPLPLSGCRASQRLLLSVPDAAVVLCASMWGGVGALNTHKITDITRHPFETAASGDASRAAESGGKMKSVPVPPILALCTQLIDLNKAGDGESSQPTGGDSCNSCVFVNEETIQIISRNHTVHLFRLQSDLKSITHNHLNRLLHPEASPAVFNLLRTRVGFGWGKGGVWVRVGYIAAGAATRGSSPFAFMSTPWKGPSSPSGSHLAPFAATLSLFQSLSPLPDIPVASITTPSASKQAVSPFSMGGSSSTQRDSGSSTSSGFGFGFGMMSKLRAAEPSQSDTAPKRDAKADSVTRSAFLSSLVARFESLFLFTEAAAAAMLAARRVGGQREGGTFRSRRDQYRDPDKDLSSLAVAALDSIDDECASRRTSSSDLTSKRTAHGPSIGLLAELSCGLRPVVRALLESRTAEDERLRTIQKYL